MTAPTGRQAAALFGLYPELLLDAEERDCLLMALLAAAAVGTEQVRELLETRLFMQSVERDVDGL